MATDYYEVLGVRRDASNDELKRAYRKLARELHPDVNPDPAAQQRFKAVTAAYEVLSDPEKRQLVDLGGDPLAPGGGGANGAPFGAGFGGLGDIMDAFFGGGANRGPRSRVRRGNDALLRLELDLAETAFGATREITVDTAAVCMTCSGEGAAPGSHPATCSVCHGRGEIQQVTRSFLGQMVTSRPCTRCGATGTVIEHPCRECGGDGRVRKRRNLTVKIPSGVEDGMRIRLSGEGEVGPGGGPNGDLYVEVQERPHPVFTREGDDLHCELRIPMTAAALGTTCGLETLDGGETLTVKPGTQPGHVITMSGRGVPHLRSVGRGHLHIHVVVETPTKIDPEQEKLLRELAKLRDEEQPAVVTSGNGTVDGQGFFSRLRGARGTR
ncbi:MULTISPECIES: molecular chaperone DnaJ [unclassified Frankia]|uniref:molecular chaperone DnaJ n=2 Tax=Frankia TaxID=1854 RepID=UPI001EF6C548|nr:MULTISPECIES: molecular chaperone DnaJ [unclassified Frankia]